MRFFLKKTQFGRKYLPIFASEYGKLQICRGKNFELVSNS
jgi:hypothetical protein